MVRVVSKKVEDWFFPERLVCLFLQIVLRRKGRSPYFWVLKDDYEVDFIIS
jgi:predicted AAA+ superfamily ATPase